MGDDAKDKPLRSAAVECVQDAVGRGLHRRARRERALGRGTDGALGVVVPETRNIVVGGRPKSERVVGTAVPYANRGTVVRDGSSDDDDSNDEWEEHVEVDERAARRAVHRAEKMAAKHASLKKRKEALAARKAEEKGEIERKASEKTAEEREEIGKRAARLAAAKERASANRLHEMHMVVLCGTVVRMDMAADDEELQALALSVAPTDVLPSENGIREALARLALWARAEFRVVPLYPSMRRRDRPCSQISRVKRALVTGAAHVLDLAVVFAAMLRADGERVRVVMPLRPTPEKAMRSRGGKKAVVVKSGRVARACVMNEALIEHGVDMYAWLEVWNEAENMWLPLDFVTGLLGLTSCDQIVEAMRAHAKGLLERAELNAKSMNKTGVSKRSGNKSLAAANSIDETWLARVVAAEHGVLIDVTRRYVQQWRVVEKERRVGRPFARILKELSAAQCDEDVALAAEQKLFDELAVHDEMPTSVAALHKHPRYVLERHLKKYEMVYPREPIVGHLKKEPIFLRSHVQLLHTRERWIRKMRSVRDGETAVKHVKSMNREIEQKTELFGEWQTEELVIAGVENGVIPRNSRGNVELWTEQHLPRGAVHVNIRYAAAAARALDVDFVPAMTGFDIRSGRSVPRIEGVVVASEHAEAVSAGALEKERAAFERAEGRAREEALLRWRAVLKAMSAREKVRRKYGGLIDDDGNYEAVEKRRGVKRARDEKMGSARGASPKSDRATYSGGTAEAHTHVFENERQVDGDAWVKTCRICKLDVMFEKL